MHVEVIVSVDTYSSLAILRTQKPCETLSSYCVTNFIGVCKELGMDKWSRGTSVSGDAHRSHRGGSWERMIGIARRILDSLFLQLNTHLTHASQQISFAH